MLLQVFYFILSIIGLYFGAEISLESSERVGRALKLSPLLIGMFIVGFGTSLPEFFVSQLACFRGFYSMGVGNIIGSNIANIFLILGVSSVIYALGLEGKAIKMQFYFHLVVSSIMGIFLYFREINLITTIVMAVFMAVYFYLNLKGDKDNQDNQDNQGDQEDYKVSKLDYLKILVGFTLLYGSGELLVYSGSNIGRSWGVSEFAISAIFVAFGTSFPEFVTSLLACFRKKDVGIIIGNIIGSNIFNGAFILGSIGIYNFKLDSPFTYEIIALIGVSILFIFFNNFKFRISKKVSLLFLPIYALFVWYWLN